MDYAAHLSGALEPLARGATAYVRSTPAVVATLSVYLLYAVVHWERDPSGSSARRFPQRFVVAYNVAVALVTAAFVARLAAVLAAHMALAGAWHAACAPDAVTGDAPLGALLNEHSMMRIIELFDTVLIVHSSRQLTFLHVWHHAATLALAHLQLVDATPLQWLTIGLNACVHVLMYLYYAAAALSASRVPAWCKRAVTNLQIGQFVVLLAVYGAVFVARARGSVECFSTPRSTVAGFVVLASYLVLFVRFHRRAYGAPVGAKRD